MAALLLLPVFVPGVPILPAVLPLPAETENGAAHHDRADLVRAAHGATGRSGSFISTTGRPRGLSKP